MKQARKSKARSLPATGCARAPSPIDPHPRPPCEQRFRERPLAPIQQPPNLLHRLMALRHQRRGISKSHAVLLEFILIVQMNRRRVVPQNQIQIQVDIPHGPIVPIRARGNIDVQKLRRPDLIPPHVQHIRLFRPKRAQKIFLPSPAPPITFNRRSRRDERRQPVLPPINLPHPIPIMQAAVVLRRIENQVAQAGDSKSETAIAIYPLCRLAATPQGCAFLFPPPLVLRGRVRVGGHSHFFKACAIALPHGTGCVVATPARVPCGDQPATSRNCPPCFCRVTGRFDPSEL